MIPFSKSLKIFLLLVLSSRSPVFADLPQNNQTTNLPVQSTSSPSINTSSQIPTSDPLALADQALSRVSAQNHLSNRVHNIAIDFVTYTGQEAPAAVLQYLAQQPLTREQIRSIHLINRPERRQTIATLYSFFLDREPEPQGLEYWATSSLNISQIGHAIKNSAERNLKINQLYSDLLNRTLDPVTLVYLANQSIPISQYRAMIKGSEERRELVRNLFTDLLGRPASVDEVQAFALSDFSFVQIKENLRTSAERKNTIAQLFQYYLGRAASPTDLNTTSHIDPLKAILRNSQERKNRIANLYATYLGTTSVDLGVVWQQSVSDASIAQISDQILSSDDYQRLHRIGPHPLINRLSAIQSLRQAANQYIGSNLRPTILVGDSITQNFDRSFLPSNEPFLNQGIAGSTASDIANRVSLFDQVEASRIYVLAGINDIGVGFTDREIKDNIQLIIRRLSAAHPQTPIIIQSILPTANTVKNARIRNLNREINLMIAQLQNEGLHVSFLDLHPAFANSQGTIQTDLSSDGLHLNARGYQRLASMLSNNRPY
jgi:lysophospholipase L1-like esterase